jgi:folate-binding protein YgfZ
MSNWQNFLEAQGATCHADGEINFAASGLGNTASTHLTELGYQGLLAFDGPDASKFLQGQITTDVRELENQQWKLGAQCNLKGRMEASFALVQTAPEQILLRCHGSLTDSLAQNLHKYAVFSKVTINSVSQNWRRLGLWGDQACELIGAQCQLPAISIGATAANQDCIALRLEEQRYELWVNPERAQTLWQALASHCTPTDSQQWRLADIRAGWAEITAANAGEFSPHELHYPLLGAVSFKKGCYTGQEVVARLHYKGKLKKHVARIAFNATKQPEHTIVDAQGSRRGTLIMASPAQQGWEGLAVIPDDTSHELFIATNGEAPTAAKIARMSLPYAPPTADNDS